MSNTRTTTYNLSVTNLTSLMRTIRANQNKLSPAISEGILYISVNSSQFCVEKDLPDNRISTALMRCQTRSRSANFDIYKLENNIIGMIEAFLQENNEPDAVEIVNTLRGYTKAQTRLAVRDGIVEDLMND